MRNGDRYSGVMPRVLIVLALGFLAGLVIPVSCHGQTKPTRPDSSVSAPDGTTVRDTTPPVVTDSAKAAQLATLDSLFKKIDSVLARTSSWPADPVLMEPRVEVNWRTRSYAGAILLGLAANTVLHLDRDPCANGHRVCFHTAYRDSFWTRDKIDHFSASYFLTNGASEFGVPKWAAFGLTCGLAGPGFELTQGSVSWKDIVADCAGSATSLGLQSVLRKMHDAGWLQLRAPRRRVVPVAFLDRHVVSAPQTRALPAPTNVALTLHGKQVVAREQVPALAMRALQFSPSGVLCVRDDLQVLGIHARPIAAEMVEHHALRDWPDPQLVGVSVGAVFLPVAPRGLPVSLNPITGPLPAFPGLSAQRVELLRQRSNTASCHRGNIAPNARNFQRRIA